MRVWLTATKMPGEVVYPAIGLSADVAYERIAAVSFDGSRMRILMGMGMRMRRPFKHGHVGVWEVVGSLMPDCLVA